MKNLKTIILILVVLICVLYSKHVLAYSSSSYNSDISNTISILLTHQDQKLQISEVEFYKSVVTQIKDKKLWDIADPQNVSKYLNTSSSIKINTLPNISKQSLYKHLKLIKSRYYKKNNIEILKVVIPQVQKMLDTLALYGAIITDCSSTLQGQIKECSLYFYNRSQGRIIASSSKTFITPVDDATRWAPILVNNLKSGLDEHQTAQEQQKLSKVVNELNEPQTTEVGAFLGFAISASSIKVKNVDLNFVPKAELNLGLYKDNILFGIQGGYAFSQTQSENKQQKFNAKNLGLVFSVYAQALEILIWNMDIGAGIEKRSISSQDSLLQSTQFYILLRPVCLWNLGSQWSTGIEAHYLNYSTIKQTRSAEFEHSKFATNEYGLGMMIRKIF